MGYTYDETTKKWTTTDNDGNKVEAKGAALAIVDLKIKDADGTTIQNRVNKMRVKDLIKTEGTPMSLLDNEVTVENAATKMQERLQTATIAEMAEYGIIDLNTVVDDTDGTTVEGALTYILGNDSWKGKTTSALLTELVTKAYELKKTATPTP